MAVPMKYRSTGRGLPPAARPEHALPLRLWLDRSGGMYEDEATVVAARVLAGAPGQLVQVVEFTHQVSSPLRVRVPEASDDLVPALWAELEASRSLEPQGTDLSLVLSVVATLPTGFDDVVVTDLHVPPPAPGDRVPASMRFAVPAYAWDDRLVAAFLAAWPQQGGPYPAVERVEHHPPSERTAP